MTPSGTGTGANGGQNRPERLPEGARVVVKVGSSSLTRTDGGLDLNRIDILAGLIAGMRRRGHDVVLVPSGAVASGTTTLIARADDAAALLGQEQVPTDLGTWFEPTGPHRPSRRLWMAHASQPDGRVLIDAGAARALTVGKKSLLLPGLTGLDGDFESGSVVDVVGPEGVLARGICRYAAAELREVLGARSEGAPAPDHVAPVIHRDDLAELPRIAGV